MENDVNVLVDIVLPITLILIMFGMGMTLRVKDFIRLKDYPRAVVAGLIGQLILLPLVGGALAVLWGLPPELAIGLIILAACPGGTTSNLVSHLARGDKPLSITLTAVNSFVVVFTIPLLISLSMVYFLGSAPDDVPTPVLFIMVGVFAYTIVPISLGMLLRKLAPRFSMRIGPLYDRFAALAFLFIVLIILWAERDDLLTILPMVGGVTLTLNLVMTAIGLGLAWLLALRLRQALTIGIEVGIQNTPLGMAVAGTLLHGVRGLDGDVMLMPAALYGLLMFGSATVLIFYGQKHLGSDAGVAPR